MTCHIMEKSPQTLSSMYVRSVLFRALRIAATVSGALPPDINKRKVKNTNGVSHSSFFIFHSSFKEEPPCRAHYRPI